MWILQLLLLVLSAECAKIAGDGTEQIKCDGVIFHDVYYDKQLLFQGLGTSYNLMMHEFSGDLFFSHTVTNKNRIEIMACHIEQRSCRRIPGVSGGYAVAYDRGNDDIYFGGHNGIYKYNFIKKSAQFFAEKGKSIWGLFIRRNFYYIEYPRQKLYVYYRGEFARVLPAIGTEVDHFFISKGYEIYVANRTALYKAPLYNKKQLVVLDDKIIVRQITEDFYGDIYFCASDGIYVEDVANEKLKKVADIDQIYGMTFINIFTTKHTRNQLIYSDVDAIYRLLPSRHSRFCLNALANNRTSSLNASVPLTLTSIDSELNNQTSHKDTLISSSTTLSSTVSKSETAASTGSTLLSTMSQTTSSETLTSSLTPSTTAVSQSQQTSESQSQQTSESLSPRITPSEPISSISKLSPASTLVSVTRTLSPTPQPYLHSTPNIISSPNTILNSSVIPLSVPLFSPAPSLTSVLFMPSITSSALSPITPLTPIPITLDTTRPSLNDTLMSISSMSTSSFLSTVSLSNSSMITVSTEALKQNATIATTKKN